MILKLGVKMSYNTEKRNLLIEFFKANSQNSYTVEELCCHVLPDGRAKSTVYRIVSRLCEEGLLEKVLDSNTGLISYQYMDGSCHRHLHLKCKDCGSLIHLDEKISHLLFEELYENHGFSLDGGAMLFGKCRLCGKGV